jgi:DNA-binding MarR family transcriptional regulator
METKSFGTLVGEGMQALFPFYRDPREKLYEELGIEGINFWVAWTASKLEPEPISVAQFLRMGPYNSAAPLEERIAGAVDKGLLEEGPEAEFRLTEKGRTIVHRIMQEAIYAPLAAAEIPMSADDLERMATLLRRVVDSVEGADEPPKIHFALSRTTDQGDDAAVVVRIDQYLTDLATFRDDAHLGAWQGYDVSGPAWEVLTYLWREGMEPLKERFEVRQHPEGTLEKALQELVKLGWAAQDGESYEITDQGRELRQQAEDATDQLYYGPWDCLDEKEQKELRGLLERLIDELREEEEESE